EARSEGKVRAELPRIQEVSLIGLRGKVARAGCSCRQQSAVLAEGEVGGVLRKPADDRRSRVLYRRDAAAVQPIGSARQAVCRQEILEGAGNMVARPEIERRVGDCVIEGIGKADAPVADRAEIDPVLGDVFPMGPGNVIGNVVDRSHAAYVMELAVRR